jgi:glycosyltransferase involved in cell wall biosynthesis
VVPGDVAAMAARATELLRDDALRARMGEAAARAAARFSLARMIEETRRTYSRVVQAVVTPA